MKIYIVDDDIAVVKTLERIMIDRKIGEVCGSNTNAEIAIREIREEKPDLVITDFLMKEMDGITLIDRVHSMDDSITFVMLSKVSEKSLVQDAYASGVEFFISKPINFLEVERVLQNVMERINLKNAMKNLKSVFGELEIGNTPARVREPKSSCSPDILLGTLGMLGEKGTKDIRMIYEYMVEHGIGFDKEVLVSVAEEEDDTVKNVEQRVRRAIKKGLTNAATARLEDPDSDVSVIYSGYVFDHVSIKNEMDYLEDRAKTGGRVNIAKFMDGLVFYMENN